MTHTLNLILDDPVNVLKWDVFVSEKDARNIPEGVF